ncbi:MAG: hypothetical protein V4446_05635 [Pseudomonadota bacterium]
MSSNLRGFGVVPAMIELFPAQSLSPLWLACLAAWMLSGCMGGANVKARAQILNQFVVLEQDSRIRYESGAQVYAERVAALLPAAVAQVEAAHYRPFVGAVRLYVCGTEACFKSLVYTPNLTAAVVPDNRLILSPRLFLGEQNRLYPILVHELSHLHLGLQIGHYDHSVPIWFHEGLATLAATGGGAEYASDDDAIAAIKAGYQIMPAVRDSVIKRHRAEDWGLSIHVFYRQALRMVSYLRQLDEDKFRQFLLELQDNVDFDIAFDNAYTSSVARTLQGYYDSINPVR